MRSDAFARHMKRRDHLQDNVEDDSLQEMKETPSRMDQCESDGKSLSSEKDKIGKYAWKDSGVDRNHHFLLPRNIRAIVCGKSGVGKTCLVTYLLLEPDTLDYNNLIICGKSLHQPEYKIMKATFSRGWSKSQVNKLFELQEHIDDVDQTIETYKGKCKGGIDATFIDDPLNIPDPAEHDPTLNNLLVLDDVMLGPQSKAEAYY